MTLSSYCGFRVLLPELLLEVVRFPVCMQPQPVLGDMEKTESPMFFRINVFTDVLG